MTAGTAEPVFLNIARTYHDYLSANGVTNLFLQVEQGLGHERESWNRQLHNFTQRIFKVAPRQAIMQAATGISIASPALPGEGRTAHRFLVRLDGRTVAQPTAAPLQ